MRNYITVLLVGLSSIVFGNAQVELNNWLDSTYQANEISLNDIQGEFKAYTRENYKEAASVSEFLYQFKPKKRTKGPKEFKLNSKLNFPTLFNIAFIGTNHLQALENELYRIIFANGLEKDQNAFTYLWIYLNHLNNLPLNDTRPNDMTYELFELKRYMMLEEDLFERVALIILARKIFLENTYISSDALVKKTFPSTKVIYLEKENSKEKDSTFSETVEPLPNYSEVEPSFIGGIDNMTSYILLNINYPQFAKEMGERGIVFIKFIVDTDGTVTNVGIRKGVTTSLDREAVRVIQLMPKWIPGEQMNKPVRVSYTIPIQFRLG